MCVTVNQQQSTLTQDKTLASWSGGGIDVKKNVFTFLVRARFFTFFNVFFICPRFLFLKTFIENTIWNHFRNKGNKLGSVWLFYFVPMLEFPYRPIYWQALLFTYRIGLHKVTPLGVVFLFMLVNWWVENINVFLFNVYKRLFCFWHVF